MIIEYVQPNRVPTDYLSMLLNTRNLNPGDMMVKKVRKGIEVRSLVPGSIHLASQITVSDRINYQLDGSNVKVTLSEQDLKNGDIGTVESIKSEMVGKLVDNYANKVFTALSTIWNASNTPDNYATVSTNISSSALKSAIDAINNTAGGAKVIIGARSALTPITEFGGSWASPSGSAPSYFPVNPALEEIMRTGWLGTYYGVPVVALDQVYDNPEDYNALIPTDKVLVVGHDVGEFIMYGQPEWKQWTNWEPTPVEINLEVYSYHGMIIDKMQGIYVIEIT